MNKKDGSKNKVYAQNRKARYDYFIEETLECGIVLVGNEVKSIKDGTVSIKESWVAIENNELFLKKAYVKNWSTTNDFDKLDETRTRKLLASKKQIRDFNTKVQREGYTLVPLRVYQSDYGKIKVEVGLGKGKHSYDKRKSIKEREMSRESKNYTT